MATNLKISILDALLIEQSMRGAYPKLVAKNFECDLCYYLRNFQENVVILG